MLEDPDFSFEPSNALVGDLVEIHRDILDECIAEWRERNPDALESERPRLVVDKMGCTDPDNAARSIRMRLQALFTLLALQMNDGEFDGHVQANGVVKDILQQTYGLSDEQAAALIPRLLGEVREHLRKCSFFFDLGHVSLEGDRITLQHDSDGIRDYEDSLMIKLD